MAGNSDDALEITQNVFLRVHQHLARYDPARPFASWLYRITVNCTYDFIKKRPASISLEDLPEPLRQERETSPDRGPERELRQREIRQVLRSLLRRLTPQERSVFVLRDLEGLDTKEIAYILGCTMVTVRRHSSSARLRLRDEIARRFPELLPRPEEG